MRLACSTSGKSLDILEKLIRSEPEQARYHAELGRTWNAMGYIHDEMRNNQKAIPAFKSAISEQENAIARSPDDNEYKMYLCTHLENLGEQYLDLGSVSDAWPYYNAGDRRSAGSSTMTTLKVWIMPKSWPTR